MSLAASNAPFSAHPTIAPLLASKARKAKSCGDRTIRCIPVGRAPPAAPNRYLRSARTVRAAHARSTERPCTPGSRAAASCRRLGPTPRVRPRASLPSTEHAGSNKGRGARARRQPICPGRGRAAVRCHHVNANTHRHDRSVLRGSQRYRACHPRKPCRPPRINPSSFRASGIVADLWQLVKDPPTSANLAA